MTRFYLILAFLCIPLVSTAQISFFKTVGSNNTDVGDDLITTQGNGYAVLLHSSFNPPLNSRVNLGIAITDVTGNTIYAAETIVDTSCVGKKILELPNKDLLVLGTASDGNFSTSNKMFVMRTNNTGTPIWCYHYKSTSSDMAADMIPTRDGNFLLLGVSNYNVNYEELLVIKIDAGGGIIWSKRIAAPAKELTGISIKEFDNGDIGIGSTLSNNLFLDVSIIKLNSIGNMIWNRVYSTTYDDELQKIVINDAHEIFIAGHSYMMGSEWNGFIAKVDSSGTLKYDHFYDGGSYNGEKIRDMELSVGRIAFVGDLGTFEERNMFLASVNVDGSIYFSKQYPYMSNFTNYPYGLEIVNGNQYAFTADIYTSFASREAGLIKTDQTGNAGCHTDDIQLTLINENFSTSDVSINVTDGNVIKSNLSYVSIIHDLYLKKICENIPPVAGFDTVTFSAICPNNCYSFTDTSLYDPVSWKWYFEGASPDTSTEPNPTNICWNNSGNFSVKLVVQSASGADSVTHILDIDLNCPIHIPNVFTPNNDGQNDVFDINGLPTNFELVIYNRWGEKVFTSGNSTDMWNGKIDNQGAAASDGVYYYLINDYDNGKKYNGFLHLFQ